MSGITDSISTKTIGSTEKVTMTRYGDGTLEFLPKLVQSGGTTNGSKVITVASTNGVVAGMPISGTGIPAGTKVVSKVTDTSITTDTNSTATATVTVTVTKTIDGKPFRTQAGCDAIDWSKALFDALAATN